MLRKAVNVAMLLWIFVAANLLYAHDSKIATEMPIEEFVRTIYIKGVPYEKARQYRSDQVDILFEMLNNVNESMYWPNIIVTIEIIGDDSSVPKVLAFIDQGADGEFSPDQYSAKKAAIFGLGYMVNNLNSKRALEYLERRMYPESWNDMEGLTAKHSEIKQRNQDLSMYAFLGLALSGTDEAIDILHSFDQHEKGDSEFRAKLDGLIGEAIKEGMKIREVGMMDYKTRHVH